MSALAEYWPDPTRSVSPTVEYERFSGLLAHWACSFKSIQWVHVHCAITYVADDVWLTEPVAVNALSAWSIGD